MARPLNVAHRLQLSSVSDGKFPLCHWAVLVSPYNTRQLTHKLESPERCSTLGTVIQLERVGSTNTATITPDFGSEGELGSDWYFPLSIADVGTTTYSDEILEDQGLISLILA
jgi:hypothetical protein